MWLVPMRKKIFDPPGEQQAQLYSASLFLMTGYVSRLSEAFRTNPYSKDPVALPSNGCKTVHALLGKADLSTTHCEASKGRWQCRAKQVQ